jgi:hypothetical protein
LLARAAAQAPFVQSSCACPRVQRDTVTKQQWDNGFRMQRLLCLTLLFYRIAPLKKTKQIVKESNQYILCTEGF